MSINWLSPSRGASCATAACTSARRSPLRCSSASGAAASSPGSGSPPTGSPPPHLHERDAPDEFLDVHAAVTQRAALAVRFRDLRREGHHALETHVLSC